MHARVNIYLPEAQKGNMLANASIEFTGDTPLIVKGFRILNGQYGPWLAWPQRTTGRKDPQTGKPEYVDIAFTADETFRKELQQLAVASYYQAIQNGQSQYPRQPAQPQQQPQPQPQQQPWGPAPGYGQYPPGPAPVPPQPQYAPAGPPMGPPAGPPVGPPPGPQYAPQYAPAPAQAPPAPPQVQAGWPQPGQTTDGGETLWR